MCFIFVKINEPISIHQYQLKFILSDFLYFYSRSFFSSRIPSRITHYIGLLCSLRLLLVGEFLNFLDFDVLTVLGSIGQIFCRMFLYWDLSGIFLKFRLGLWVLGRKVTEIKYRFHHISSKVQTINTKSSLILTLIIWLRQCLSGFSTVKFFLFLPFHTAFLSTFLT